MRCLITGVDEHGRSCVVEERELPAAVPGVDAQTVYQMTEVPPPPRPPGSGSLVDLGVGPGQVRWMLIRWSPGAQADYHHHTDTIDLDIVVEGSIEVILDDGPHLLGVGDAVVLTGVDHAWRAGPAGAVTSVALFGTPPPD